MWRTNVHRHILWRSCDVAWNKSRDQGHAPCNHQSQHTAQRWCWIKAARQPLFPLCSLFLAPTSLVRLFVVALACYT